MVAKIVPSALLLIGRQEEYSAHKNLCFKTPWDTAIAVKGELNPENNMA